MKTFKNIQKYSKNGVKCLKIFENIRLLTTDPPSLKLWRDKFHRLHGLVLPARERNLDTISLSNCPKLSDNPRIKTVEYNIAGNRCSEQGASLTGFSVAPKVLYLVPAKKPKIVNGPNYS